MNRPIPFGPWANPPLKAGIYAATVEEVRQNTYGPHDDPMLKLVFQLAGQYFVSHIYFPHEFSQKCQQRFSFFCQAIAVEPYDVMNDPGSATGKELAVEICVVHPTAANHGQPYSDVNRFLPIAALGEESSSKTTGFASIAV